jgi:hypothetical protein
VGTPGSKYVVVCANDEERSRPAAARTLNHIFALAVVYEMPKLGGRTGEKLTMLELRANVSTLKAHARP